MKRRTKVIVGLLLAAGIVIITARGVIRYYIARGPNSATYFYAGSIYQKCLAASNKTQIEEIMSGKAVSRKISPSESPWGYNYTLSPGEYMVQYLVADVEPIDIVYNDKDQIVELFESYE